MINSSRDHLTESSSAESAEISGECEKDLQSLYVNPHQSRVSPELQFRWEEGLRKGSFEVYKEVFEHYTPGLVRFAWLTLRSDIAEEIVQEVMLNLWLQRETLETRAGLSAYLFRAVKNRAANWMRHQAVFQDFELSASDHSTIGMGSHNLSPVEETLENEIQTAVRLAISSLSPLQREVITLRWEEQLSYDEIAAALSISVEAARQNGSRAQRAIRGLLEKLL